MDISTRHHPTGHSGHSPPESPLANRTRPGFGLAPSAGTVYTCPMHSDVRLDHPGNCPKCGMTLEPALPAAGALFPFTG